MEYHQAFARLKIDECSQIFRRGRIRIMKRVLYIQNGEFDPPGLVAKALAERGLNLDIVHAWNGEKLPGTPGDWSGIVIGGGSMSAYEKAQYPYLAKEEALIIEARRVKRPVLGMCLGAQLMAGAFGGKVYANHAKEIGFYDVAFTSEAKTDPLWRDHTTTFQPVQWHGDTFTLPPGAILLASSAITPNQLFRLDENLYGFQFHLEIDQPSLIEMIESDDEGWLPKNGVNPRDFIKAARAALPKVEPLAHAIFGRWTEMLA
jgi:GMP synthase (glutamine-hydrolysing)